MSDTVEPTGTAPGCQVDRRAPVRRCDCSGRAGRARLPSRRRPAARAPQRPREAAKRTADAEPPLPVAVTTSVTTEPMSPGVSVYAGAVAPRIATQPAPADVQRCHWYAKLDGAPVHEPTDEVRICPACGVPATAGGVVAAGRAAALEAVATASVGGDVALAAPACACAVTLSVSACPTSSIDGRYVSCSAPGIGAQSAPAASQRSH